MSSFTDPQIECRVLLCGRNFELLRPFTFYTRHTPPEGTQLPEHAGGQFYDIVVHAGLITDFASTPRLTWSLLPPIGKFSKAAVVHDYLYIRQIGDRAWADRVFLEAMHVSRVNIINRYLYYWGVRAFGWWAWRKWRKVKESAND